MIRTLAVWTRQPKKASEVRAPKTAGSSTLSRRRSGLEDAGKNYPNPLMATPWRRRNQLAKGRGAQALWEPRSADKSPEVLQRENDRLNKEFGLGRLDKASV